MNENISLGEAFAHCMSTFSWWAFVIGAMIVFLLCVFWSVKTVRAESAPRWYIPVIALFILIATIFWRPVEVKQNTTKEQASRGIFLGY